MQLTGAFGVFGSAVVFLLSAFSGGDSTARLPFFRIFSYLGSICGGVCLITAGIYLIYVKPRQIRLEEEKEGIVSENVEFDLKKIDLDIKV
jgi:hypothetical protein